MLWMCSKWLNFRIKKLHFRIKQKLITTMHKICKKEQQQHLKEKKVDAIFNRITELKG